MDLWTEVTDNGGILFLVMYCDTVPLSMWLHSIKTTFSAAFNALLGRGLNETAGLSHRLVEGTETGKTSWLTETTDDMIEDT